MAHRGKDYRVPKCLVTELRTTEPLVCTRCPCPKFWDTEYRTVESIVCTMCPCQNFGTLNFGLPNRWFVQGVRVPKCWDPELRTAETLVCTRCPCPEFWGTEFLTRCSDYQGAPIIIIRSLTVLPSGRIIKVSRFSRCGTGVTHVPPRQ